VGVVICGEDLKEQQHRRTAVTWTSSTVTLELRLETCSFVPVSSVRGAATGGGGGEVAMAATWSE
jgi:hypothetical protein